MNEFELIQQYFAKSAAINLPDGDAALVLMLCQSNLQVKALLEAEASMRAEQDQANKRNQ